MSVSSLVSASRFEFASLASVSNVAFAILLWLAGTVTADAQTQSPSGPPAAQAKSANKAKSASKANPAAAAAKQPDTQKWIPMVDHWKPCEFGGDGPVEIKAVQPKPTETQKSKSKKASPQINLGFGDPLTGVRWTGPFPRDNYEWRYRARRTDGFDFFAAATFPIDKQHATFVPAGWGGGVTGISNIDHFDASENESTQYFPLDDDKWYTFRIRVTPEYIETFIDDKPVHKVERKEKQFSLRAEMEACKPLGLANFQGDAEIKDMEYRPLGKNNIKQDAGNKHDAGIKLDAGKNHDASKTGDSDKPQDTR
ncbi:MAG: family 16 glycoside hydrolase [Planctomycetota bacterium]